MVWYLYFIPAGKFVLQVKEKFVIQKRNIEDIRTIKTFHIQIYRFIKTSWQAAPWHIHILCPNSLWNTKTSLLLILFKFSIAAGTKVFLYRLVFHLKATNRRPEGSNWKSFLKECDRSFKTAFALLFIYLSPRFFSQWIMRRKKWFVLCQIMTVFTFLGDYSFKLPTATQHNFYSIFYNGIKFELLLYSSVKFHFVITANLCHFLWTQHYCLFLSFITRTNVYGIGLFELVWA